MYSVKLDQKAIEALSKEVNGNGGNQTFLKKLNSSYDCGGGFEDRFRAILACIDK